MQNRTLLSNSSPLIYYRRGIIQIPVDLFPMPVRTWPPSHRKFRQCPSRETCFTRAPRPGLPRRPIRPPLALLGPSSGNASLLKKLILFARNMECVCVEKEALGTVIGVEEGFVRTAAIMGALIDSSFVCGYHYSGCDVTTWYVQNFAEQVSIST